jgi:hypothetical protein
MPAVGAAAPRACLGIFTPGGAIGLCDGTPVIGAAIGLIACPAGGRGTVAATAEAGEGLGRAGIAF